MKIKEMTPESRPRERLLKNGPSGLSDSELIAIMLGSGIKGKNITALSREIVRKLDKEDYIVDVESLMKINGLGQAKASVLAAALEFSRRIMLPGSGKIRNPKDILKAVNHYSDRPQEYFLCLSLNGAYEISHIRVVSIGLVNRTMVHPREVFAQPVQDRAAAVICAHNHPSGNTEPSKEDEDVTKLLKNAGKLLGIELLDHIIFSTKGYYSFAENGKL